MTEIELQQKYPWIKWREPLPAKSFDGEAGLACRLCIGTRGLKAEDIRNLPKTREEFDKHMKEMHP